MAFIPPKSRKRSGAKGAAFDVPIFGLGAMGPTVGAQANRAIARTMDKARVSRWKEDKDAWKMGGRFFDKQVEVLDLLGSIPGDDAKYICYGGAKGAGKSHLIAAAVLRWVWTYPGCTIAILRRTIKELEKELWPKIVGSFEVLRETHEIGHDFWAQDNRLVLHDGPGGAGYSQIMVFAGNNPESFQGGNWDFAVIDEGVNVNDKGWEEVIDRTRGSDVGRSKHYPRAVLTCTNPGTGFVKRVFHDRARKGLIGPGAPFAHTLSDDERWFCERTYFIKATVWDNPYLPANYVSQVLGPRPSPRKKRELMGDWEGIEGIVWDFQPDLNEWDGTFEELTKAPEHTIDGFYGYDYGKSHEGAAVYGFIFGGVLYIYDEMCEAEVPLADWATYLKSRPGITFADKSVAWMSHVDGNRADKIGAVLAKAGVRFKQANLGDGKENVVGGVEIVQTLLRAGLLKIHKTRCEKLIEGVQNWSRKRKTDSDDFEPDKWEEAYKDRADALRYLCINVFHETAIRDVDKFAAADASGQNQGMTFEEYLEMRAQAEAKAASSIARALELHPPKTMSDLELVSHAY